MSVKIYDTMTTATPNFPLAYAEKINIVKEDGSEADIQTLYNNGELSGGDTSLTLTESQYLALPEEQKLNNSYYLYDIGVHYKNGVAYSRKKPIQLTMEEYKALGEVDPDQEYIVSADEQGILLEASDIGYSNAVSNLPCTTVQGAIDKIDGKVEEISRMKIYTNVKQLGLESKCSTVDIFKAMPNNSLAIIGTFPIVSDEYCMLIDKPTSYDGLLTIVKFNHARFSIEYKLSGGDTKYPNIMYVGNFAGSEPTTIDWQELATMDKVNALHKETVGYITESLLGSVVKNANLYYQKFGDSRLVINGWVSIDAVSTKTPIFTLPNNWKANSNYLLPCYVDNSNVACACVIDIETGTVKSYTPLPATAELRFCGEIYLT